ncbi:MAG: VWA domain-containing protein [Chloroflexota bacterium]
MNFSFPIAFLLLLTIPYFVWVGRPRNTAVRRWREWTSLGVRIVILLLLTLSLAGTQFVQAADQLAVIFLVDHSDSISNEQKETAETYIRTAVEAMPLNDQAAVIVFGSDALVDRPMSGLAELAPIQSAPQQLQTNLAEAIQLGLALFPAGHARRLVILSDGADTVGEALEAADLAAAAGVEISYVPLSQSVPDDEALLTSVRAPARVVEGETFRIEVTAESTTDMPAFLRVTSGGDVIHSEEVQLRRGVNNLVVRLRATEQQFARFRVQLTPEFDTYFQNNQMAAFTEIVGPPRVLIIAEEGAVDGNGEPIPDESPQIQLALQSAGLNVERTTPSDLPASLAELSNYASIILVNVNAKNLSPRKMDIIQSYVRDLGGGLVAVGGPESYGMGGYFGTALEETLPVDMQIKDQERFPSVSIVLIIDRSGSMGADEGGVTKIQLAAEGAVRVVELLNDFDEITVIPVDTQANNPIGPLSAGDKETAVNLIRRIGAGGGGIYVRTGLEAASQALASSSTQVKHIVILADGADSEQKEGVPELIRGLATEDVTISTVSIGQGPDTGWLRDMAEIGNGRFHLTNEAANLPQIFTQETTAIQRSYLIEERFFPTLNSNSPILTGITAVPPLYGYVGTSPKDTAQVILETHQGDPLLASWQYGLGRVVAWTSDATGRWAIDWVQWNGFAAFWTQTVRWTNAQEQESNLEAFVTYSNDQAILTVDARDETAGFVNNLTLETNVVGPEGAVENIPLQQVGPGQYEASFVPNTDGAYFMRVAGANESSDENGETIGQTVGWVLGYSPEYASFESNVGLLESMATTTGGQDLSAQETAVFSHDLPSEPASRPIWHWLTLTAVLLLPIDIAFRRLVVTRQDMQNAWAATFGRFQTQPVAPAPRTEQVSRLFQAKDRAAAPKAAPEPSKDAPPPIQRQDAVEQAKPQPKKEQPSSSPTAKTPPASGTLASRLLEKRKSQNNDNN